MYAYAQLCIIIVELLSCIIELIKQHYNNIPKASISASFCHSTQQLKFFMAFRGRIQIELPSMKHTTAYFVPSIAY